ncbi:MAG: hypothetical protein MJK12_06745 [Colwellia sp.]|nr:hypothetical protein [Colwellia sp.]
MNNFKSNVEQLHEAGAINKHELSEENIKAIDGLSQEEVGHLKISATSTKQVSTTAGVAI